MSLAHRRSRLATRLKYATARRNVRRDALLVVGGLILLGAVWILITALLARNAAQQVRDDLEHARALVAQGDLAGARAVAAGIPAKASRLEDLTGGPAWWIAAHVPYLGAPAAEVRDAAAAAALVGRDAIPPLVEVANDLQPSRLRVARDTVDLSLLESARPQLTRAAAALQHALDRLAAAPGSTWLRQVDRPIASLASQLRGVSGYVAAAARAAQVLPPLLGADHPQRYFVGLQNEAELRGTGGLPGAFAIAVADKGRVRFVHYGSDQEILSAPGGPYVRTGLTFGAGYEHAYGASLPASSLLNSNVSPHFPYAAEIWARMWERVSGQHVDGALALDPAVLSYLLGVTGPVVTVPQHVTVDAANVVDLTERAEYAMYPDNAQRKAFLVSVLKATASRVTGGGGSAGGLAQAIVRATKEQRFQVWTSDPAAESVLAQTSYAAAVPDGDQPLAAVVLNNAASGKLDYYLHRSLDYHRSGCGSRRDVVATITLVNAAPASGLPRYVTDRADSHPGVVVHPGDNRTLLDYYATAGAELQSITVDGSPSTAAVEQDRGHPIFRLDLELPRGSTTTVVLHLTEPAGSGSPLIWRQPGVTPLAVTAASQNCS